jgi:von Willebrand factor type A domain
MFDIATIPFHFLRPLWLFALLPVAAVVLLVHRRESIAARWGGVIAPHLLKNLIVAPSRSWGISPVYLVAAGMALGIVAMSGPTWRRELPPFVEDKAPLMIALSVSSSMGRTDVAPSRLERGRQKIRDLLSARAGARSGLIAYAGTAHLVMPLTDDRAVIEPFLAALAPGLMPADGKNAAGAVALAAQSLAAEPVAGTILLVADDLGGADGATLRQAADATASRCWPCLHRKTIAMWRGSMRSASPLTAPTSGRSSAVSRPGSRQHRVTRSARNGATRAFGYYYRSHCSACSGFGAAPRWRGCLLSSYCKLGRCTRSRHRVLRIGG